MMSIMPYIGVVFSFVGSLVRSLSFLFLDDFEGKANISIAIKSGSTVLYYYYYYYYQLLGAK